MCLARRAKGFDISCSWDSFCSRGAKRRLLCLVRELGLGLKSFGSGGCKVLELGRLGADVLI